MAFTRKLSPTDIAELREERARIWAKINVYGPTRPGMTDPCWLWTGGFSAGYGTLLSWRGQQWSAARMVYAITFGKLPAALRHNCDTSLCVNPRHHEIGTVGKRFPIGPAELLQLRASGLTQQQIADRYGVPRNSVSRQLRLAPARAKVKQGTLTRNSQVRDTMTAIRALARGSWHIDGLATQLDVTRRTAYRILEAIESMGLPVQRIPDGKFMLLSIRREDVDEWMWRTPLLPVAPRQRSENVPSRAPARGAL